VPLLGRCLKSLRGAAIEGLEWIVVDDEPGGSPGVAQLVESAKASWQAPMRLVLAGNRHRAKAANAGLASASGELIHFLDDDDTIAPAFYTKTVAFLNEQPRFGAVATLAERVTERAMPDGSVREVARAPHYPETRAVSLAEFAVVQTIPPVAFVARREAVDATGGFDASFEVCEDYDFFLRFLAHSDIGILPEFLCAFHQRELDEATPRSWSNSPASHSHSLEEKLFRNALLRRDLAQGRVGTGWLLALGDMTRAAWRINLVLDALQRRSLPRFLLRRLRSKP
jgi:GT2 family glycosyltransferase